MYIAVKDVLYELSKPEFQSWEIVRCNIETRDYTVIVNTEYYEYNTQYFMKYGGLQYNPNCHLEKITEVQYNANINISADLDTPYYYPIDIVNQFIQEPFISIDIKLRYPHALKAVFDTYDNYYDFYVDFYNKYDINNLYISCTEKDNILQNDIVVKPMQEWYTYVYNIVNNEGGLL